MTRMAKSLDFIPDLVLEFEEPPEEVLIKGQAPSFDYPFVLRDLYPTVPSLNALDAYERIREEFVKIDLLLSDQLKLRSAYGFPSAHDRNEAILLLGVLFDESRARVSMIDLKKKPPGEKAVQLFRLGSPLPFPMSSASPQKLLHTLQWVDVNIKVTVEILTEPYHLPSSARQQIVESALFIYSVLLKQQDYQLVRTINFNHSMFIQDRILNLLLGDSIYHSPYQITGRGKLANTIALELLKGMGEVSYRQMCALSVFMGVIWSSGKDIQESFETKADLALAKIESELKARQDNWCIDHRDEFIRSVAGEEETYSLVVFLDDNGESVFDVALFQRLLNDHSSLRVRFVVNEYPVSNNIALETLNALLEDPYFADLREHRSSLRAELSVERQAFRSFEVAHLSMETVQAVQNANLVYIKGANFFETVQLPAVERYHCFTVYGPTCVMLTGCPENSGVFAHLEKGVPGYVYHSYQNVETLRQKASTHRSKFGGL